MSSIKLFLTSFLFILSTFYCTAQDSIVISGKIQNNTRFAKVVVKKFGVGSFDIAAVPIHQGEFRIVAPKETEPGVYRFQYSQNSLSEYVDVIIDGKEPLISFSLDVANPIEDRAVVFSQSAQNKAWYGYKAEEKLRLKKLQALQNALALYPDSKDEIVKQLKTAISKEQKSYDKAYQQFTKTYVGTWAGDMVANTRAYFTNPKDDWRIQDFEHRNHFWDAVDTKNPKLIHSPLYTEQILNYLQYYMNPEMKFGEEEMKAGFKKSVDTIVQRFSGNDTTRRFAIKYLQLGFKDIGQEEVLQYIDQKYAVAEQCNSNEPDDELQKRLKGYEALKIGNAAPELYITDSTGTKLGLKDLPQDKIVLVFWASWCPHCIDEMPRINQWASEQKDAVVIAISLDDNAEAYKQAIAAYPNMVHVCDLQKWKGQTVQDYYIVATPTIITLDKERKITGKYSNSEELIKK